MVPSNAPRWRRSRASERTLRNSPVKMDSGSVLHDAGEPHAAYASNADKMQQIRFGK